ncbi:hypothetical protein AYI69_g8988, partial [Smittium culicis]
MSFESFVDVKFIYGLAVAGNIVFWSVILGSNPRFKGTIFDKSYKFFIVTAPELIKYYFEMIFGEMKRNDEPIDYYYYMIWFYRAIFVTGYFVLMFVYWVYTFPLYSVGYFGPLG